MKDKVKGMPAFDDLDPLPGQRMPWGTWYRAWAREIESEREPDGDTIAPGDDEGDGAEMPTPVPMMGGSMM